MTYFSTVRKPNRRKYVQNLMNFFGKGRIPSNKWGHWKSQKMWNKGKWNIFCLEEEAFHLGGRWRVSFYEGGILP